MLKAIVFLLYFLCVGWLLVLPTILLVACLDDISIWIRAKADCMSARDEYFR